MKLRLLFVLVSIFLFAGLSSAQRTVTNADLDKYKDKRVRAESDLRENYARLGFPSPDELERREAERAKIREDLANRLRQQDLEDARLLMQYQMAAAAARPQTIVVQTTDSGYQDGFVQYGGFGYSGYGYGNRNRRGFWPVQQQSGYFAGGQYWPTPSVVPQRPVPFIGVRRR